MYDSTTDSVAKQEHSLYKLPRGVVNKIKLIK